MLFASPYIINAALWSYFLFSERQKKLLTISDNDCWRHGETLQNKIKMLIFQQKTQPRGRETFQFNKICLQESAVRLINVFALCAKHRSRWTNAPIKYIWKAQNHFSSAVISQPDTYYLWVPLRWIKDNLLSIHNLLPLEKFFRSWGISGQGSMGL